MFLVTTVTFPPSKGVQVSETFIKAAANPLPSFMKRLYVLATNAGEIGFKVHGIYEVDDAKVPEGIKELIKYYANFDIEGFRYKIDSMFPAVEVIPLLGIKIP